MKFKFHFRIVKTINCFLSCLQFFPVKKIGIVMIVSNLFVSILMGEINPDSASSRKNSFLALPILFYTPETQWAGGLAANYIFYEQNKNDTSNPSLMFPTLIYTQRKQNISELFFDIYRKNNMYRLTGDLLYQQFPDKFYGIGNATHESDEEKYTSITFKFKISFQKLIGSNWYTGLRYEFEHYKLVELAGEGQLITGTITGSSGGSISGAGLFINYDTRDNVFFPLDGGYYRWGMMQYGTWLGSDYDFTRYIMDMRKFIKLHSSHSIAFQVYAGILSGRVPFQKLSMIASWIENGSVLRGYYNGRYRDKDLIAFQFEYRIMPVLWRFGMVLFAGFGDVSSDIENFILSRFKHASGFGLRFRLNKSEALNIRLDFAYGIHSSGMYITLGEAF